jgi:hypothetical protein
MEAVGSGAHLRDLSRRSSGLRLRRDRQRRPAARDFRPRIFEMDWPTRELYRMMINSKVGDEVVIDSLEPMKGAERPTWL